MVMIVLKRADVLSLFVGRLNLHLFIYLFIFFRDEM